MSARVDRTSPALAHPTEHPVPAVSVPLAGSTSEAVTGRRGGAARWFAFTVFLLSTGALVGSFDRGDDAEPLTVVLLGWTAMYALAGLALLDAVLRKREHVHVPLLIVTYVALGAVSVLWSVEPALTLRRSVGLAGTVVVGVYLAHRLSPVEILDALRRAMLVVAVSSLLLHAAGLPFALDEVHGTLRGVVATKNTLGRLMGIGLFAAAGVALLDRRRRRRSAVSALPMLAAIVLADSTGGSALGALALLGFGTAALWGARRGRELLVGLALVALGVAALLSSRMSVATLARATGEDTTLTGRTGVWEQSSNAAGGAPILGHGYGAFWRSEAAERIQERLQWGVSSAHNGLLDVALDLGLLGALLALVIVGALVTRGLADARAGRPQVALLRLSVAALVSVSNLAESDFLLQNQLQTLLLVAAAAIREPVDSAQPLSAWRTKSRDPFQAGRSRLHPWGG